LYRKSKAEGLTDAEKKEQELLRKEYIANVRMNLRSQLNSIDLVDEDGSVHYSNVVAYHPEQYAANVLASDRASEKLKETVKNMVTYGQFAGINFGTK
jgi:hypothetical protein